MAYEGWILFSIDVDFDELTVVEERALALPVSVLAQSGHVRTVEWSKLHGTVLVPLPSRVASACSLQYLLLH